LSDVNEWMYSDMFTSIRRQEVGWVQDDVPGVRDSRSSEAVEGGEKSEPDAEPETSVNWASVGGRAPVSVVLSVQ